MLKMRIGYQIVLNRGEIKGLAESGILNFSLDGVTVPAVGAAYLRRSVAPKLQVVSSSGINLKCVKIDESGDMTLEVLSIPEELELVE